MKHLRNLAATIAVRWHHATGPERADRGDSPVSTAIIAAIVAVGAVVVGSAVIAVATGWVENLPTGGGR